MEFKFSLSGEITITETIKLNDEKCKSLIGKVVSSGGHYIKEENHNKWSTLYDVYDSTYDANIRAERKEFNNNNNTKLTITEYLINTNQIYKLLAVISELYNKDFQRYIIECL